jgi:hypothetical protein
VSGIGSVDNSSFTISGSALFSGAAFDFEAKSNYFLRVRSTDQGGLWFEKVFAVSVLDTNEPPQAPVNLYPADGAVQQPLALTLVTSAFADPDNADSHAGSQWILRRIEDNSIVIDTGPDSVNKTSFTVPDGVLQYASAYSWDTRYEDSHGLWGEHSEATSFSTIAPSLSVFAQGSGLMISWPTNSPGFHLEFSPDPVEPNWVPDASLALASNGYFFVMKPVDGASGFYRLSKH